MVGNMDYENGHVHRKEKKSLVIGLKSAVSISIISDIISSIISNNIAIL